MLCPNCKSTINIGDSFCKSCGFNVTGIETTIEAKTTNNETNNNLNTPVNYQEQNIQNNINDSSNQQDSINFNELMDAYIGKNVDKLKSGFSFCTLFFGVLYVFYRKMWSLGFIWILINIALSIFLPKLFLLQLVLNIVVAICFKKLYISHVCNKVTKIKEQYSNLSTQDLVYLCYKKGGTTIVPVIVVMAIYALIPFISSKIVLDEIDKTKVNVSKTMAQFIVDSMENSYQILYLENMQTAPTISQLSTKFKVTGVTWNRDNKITLDNGDVTICKVLINTENQMTVECEAEGEKIVSEPMEITISENSEQNQNVQTKKPDLSNENIRHADYVIDAVEQANLRALLYYNVPITIEQVKENFDMSNAEWNDDNTITSNKYNYVCKVLINTENQMIVECEADGEKLISEPMDLDY